jgi:hypothetical protein
LIFQFVLVVSIAAYLAVVRVALGRRIRCSWEQLVREIDPGSGERAAFRNAGVLLQMIDYACQAKEPMDAALAEALRAKAMGIRIGAVWVSAPWA